MIGKDTYLKKINFHGADGNSDQVLYDDNNKITK